MTTYTARFGSGDNGAGGTYSFSFFERATKADLYFIIQEVIFEKTKINRLYDSSKLISDLGKYYKKHKITRKLKYKEVKAELEIMFARGSLEWISTGDRINFRTVHN